MKSGVTKTSLERPLFLFKESPLVKMGKAINPSVFHVYMMRGYHFPSTDPKRLAVAANTTRRAAKVIDLERFGFDFPLCCVARCTLANVSTPIPVHSLCRQVIAGMALTTQSKKQTEKIEKRMEFRW